MIKTELVPPRDRDPYRIYGFFKRWNRICDHLIKNGDIGEENRKVLSENQKRFEKILKEYKPITGDKISPDDFLSVNRRLNATYNDMKVIEMAFIKILKSPVSWFLIGLIGIALGIITVANI